MDLDYCKFTSWMCGVEGLPDQIIYLDTS